MSFALLVITPKSNSLVNAFLISDRVGRVWAAHELCVVRIAGIVIFITSNGRIGQVYAGRFVAGVGIGQTTVIAPTYLAEVAPRSIRGLCVCVFSGSVYLDIMLGYFASWGTSLHISNSSSGQWIIPTSMHIMFVGIILIFSLGVQESPRYLMNQGRVEQAAANTSTLRSLPVDHPYIQTELKDIRDQPT